MNIFRNLLACATISVCSFFLVSCGKDQEAGENETSEELTKVIILTDWYPQPEHGGFYQAQAAGFYKEVGLDVEVRSGGGIRDIRPLVALGQVQFSIGTSDTTLIGVSAGLPLVALAPFFIHDPQCVMAHESLGLNSLDDLDGKTVMMQPSLSHAQYLSQIKGLSMNLIPLDYSISRFVTDESFVQQCFATSEPVYLAEQNIDPVVIPLSESGFDPYRQIYTSRSYLDKNPEIVKKFIDASIRGWIDFIENDPTPGLEAIAKDNPQQNMDIMLKVIDKIKEYSLVHGASGNEVAGIYLEERIQNQMRILKELELISEEVTFEDSFAKKELPDRFQ